MIIDEDDLVCPITQYIMRDPVMTSNGETYERDAIEEWLKNYIHCGKYIGYSCSLDAFMFKIFTNYNYLIDNINICNMPDRKIIYNFLNSHSNMYDYGEAVRTIIKSTSINDEGLKYFISSSWEYADDLNILFDNIPLSQYKLFQYTEF